MIIVKSKQEAILSHLRTMLGHVEAEIAGIEIQGKDGLLEALHLIDEDATAIRSILDEDDAEWAAVAVESLTIAATGIGPESGRLEASGDVTFDSGVAESVAWQMVRAPGESPIVQLIYPDDSERVSATGAHGAEHEPDPWIVAFLTHPSIVGLLASRKVASHEGFGDSIRVRMDDDDKSVYLVTYDADQEPVSVVDLENGDNADYATLRAIEAELKADLTHIAPGAERTA